MTTSEISTQRDQAINIRASRRQRDLIDRAAQAVGKSRSEFMLEATCREAEDVLVNQTVFQLDTDVFAQFSALLDCPPAPTAELRRMLHRKVPWELPLPDSQHRHGCNRRIKLPSSTAASRLSTRG